MSEAAVTSSPCPDCGALVVGDSLDRAAHLGICVPHPAEPVPPHPWPLGSCWCGFPYDDEVHTHDAERQPDEIVSELRALNARRERGATVGVRNAARAEQLRRDARARRRAWWVHNLVAHPLLVLCPPVGEWLHDRTSPEPGR